MNRKKARAVMNCLRFWMKKQIMAVIANKDDALKYKNSRSSFSFPSTRMSRNGRNI